jgi:hypothetical protein
MDRSKHRLGPFAPDGASARRRKERETMRGLSWRSIARGLASLGGFTGLLPPASASPGRPSRNDGSLQVHGAALAGTVGAIALLTACAVGSQFSRPPEDSVRLGHTTRAQVEARLGRPGDEKSIRHDGLQARLIQYTYSNDAETAKMPNSLCIRSLTYVLVDDVVYAEGFVSACAADHTDFDERKAADIVKGQTRCDEVPQLLGRPSFRAIHPVAKVKGEYVIGYQFKYVKRPLLQLDMYEKDLEVVCDANGVVREVASSEAGDR